MLYAVVAACLCVKAVKAGVCICVKAGVGGSSHVWLCATSHENGQPKTIVYVLDAHNPASPLDMFSMPLTHILCIASVPSMNTEYVMT